MQSSASPLSATPSALCISRMLMSRLGSKTKPRRGKGAFWTGNEQLRGQSDLISREQHARRLLMLRAGTEGIMEEESLKRAYENRHETPRRFFVLGSSLSSECAGMTAELVIQPSDFSLEVRSLRALDYLSTSMTSNYVVGSAELPFHERRSHKVFFTFSSELICIPMRSLEYFSFFFLFFIVLQFQAK